MEARATLEQAEELRRVLDHLGERSADIWGKKKQLSSKSRGKIVR
jgi:hypothetical protein